VFIPSPHAWFGPYDTTPTSVAPAPLPREMGPPLSPWQVSCLFLPRPAAVAVRGKVIAKGRTSSGPSVRCQEAKNASLPPCLAFCLPPNCLMPAERGQPLPLSCWLWLLPLLPLPLPLPLPLLAASAAECGLPPLLLLPLLLPLVAASAAERGLPPLLLLLLPPAHLRRSGSWASASTPTSRRCTFVL
jgi:hypothetical protein